MYWECFSDCWEYSHLGEVHDVKLALFVIAVANDLQHLPSVCLVTSKTSNFQLFVNLHGLGCNVNVSFLLSFFCHLHSHIFLVNDDIIDVQGDVVAGLRHLHFCSSIFFIWLFQQPTFSLISTWPAMVKLSSTMKGMRWTCWWTLWHSCTWKGNADLVELGMDVCWEPNVDVPDFLCYLKEWWMTRVEGVVTAFQWGQKSPQKFCQKSSR